MKWNVKNIVEFLQIYQQYPVLWNIKEKDYCNIKLKDEVLRLYCVLSEKQLIGDMDMKQLKAKIKSIKDVHRQELNKIEKSKKSGCGSEDVYSPKLAWFCEANFLAEVVATRNIKSNLDLSQNSQEIVLDEDSESGRESVEFDDNNCPEERFKNKSPAKMRPPPTPIKRFKKRVKSPSEISEAIQQLDKIAQNAAEEKPYDQFEKYVASELRQLPQRQAISQQQEIQNCITRSKLSSLDSVVSSNPPVVDYAFSPSSNQSLLRNLSLQMTMRTL